MTILFTQNKSVQIRIVLSFSKVLYCGVSQFLQESTHEKHLCPWDWDAISKTRKRRNHRIISDCVTASEEGTSIHNKNVLSLWKYQVSLNLVFWIERSRNFCIFVWFAKTRGWMGGGGWGGFGESKTLIAKIW